MALASNGGNGPFEVYAYNISSHYAEFEEMSTGGHHHHHHEHDSYEHHSNSNRHSHHNINNNNEHNLHHHSLNNNFINKHISTSSSSETSNDTDTGTGTGTGTISMFDREWHREQYKLARAKIGEIKTTALIFLKILHE